MHDAKYSVKQFQKRPLDKDQEEYKINERKKIYMNKQIIIDLSSQTITQCIGTIVGNDTERNIESGICILLSFKVSFYSGKFLRFGTKRECICDTPQHIHLCFV